MNKEWYNFFNDYKGLFAALIFGVILCLIALSYVVLLMIKSLNTQKFFSIRFLYYLLPFMIVGIITVFICFRLFNYTSLYINLKNQQCDHLTGKILIQIEEEVVYRGEIQGYSLSFKMDEVDLKPINSFSADMLEFLNSNNNFVVYYGYIGDNVIILKIIIANDNACN